jgi:hypothetical protein
MKWVKGDLEGEKKVGEWPKFKGVEVATMQWWKWQCVTTLRQELANWWWNNHFFGLKSKFTSGQPVWWFFAIQKQWSCLILFC